MFKFFLKVSKIFENFHTIKRIEFRITIYDKYVFLKSLKNFRFESDFVDILNAKKTFRLGFFLKECLEN